MLVRRQPFIRFLLPLFALISLLAFFANPVSALAAEGLDASSDPAQVRVQLAEEPFTAKSFDDFEYADASSDAALASQSRILSYDQSKIDALGIQCDAWSGACLGYAAAYCEIVATGKAWSWTDFDGNGGSAGESGFYGRNMTSEFDCYQTYDQQSTLRRLYDSIDAGHPCIVYVTTTSGNQHWVAVIGYEGVDDPGNLKLSNFVMLDSNYAFDCEPALLSERGYTLRFGDTFGNVRVCKNSTDSSSRVSTEWFDDCYYGDWFVDSGVIEYAVNNSLIYGYNGTKLFKPWNYVTRGEAVTMLYRLAGEPALAQSSAFFDVNYSEYYGDAISWARSTGVVSGYGRENVFKPNQTVTREELACMIANYAEKIGGLDISSDSAAMNAMPDAAKVSTYARPSLAWCMDQGIINGVDRDDGTYIDPANGAWRASMASMITVLHRDLL